MNEQEKHRGGPVRNGTILYFMGRAAPVIREAIAARVEAEEAMVRLQSVTGFGEDK
jgi:hypothetical protein